MKTRARIGAGLSFAFCVLGGPRMLSRTDFGSKNDIVDTGIGFCFVGKAFFVGPVLLLAADKLCPEAG